MKYGEGKAEIVRTNFGDINRELLTIINSYVPLKTNNWSKGEYEETKEYTINLKFE